MNKHMVIMPTLLSVLTGLYIFSFFYHSVIAVLKRGDRVHTLFAVMCLAASIYTPSTMMLYQSSTVDQYLAINKIQLYCLSGFMISLMWFSAFYTGYRPKRFLYLMSSIYLLFAAARTPLKNQLIFSEFRNIKAFILPWGESISLADAAYTPWLYFYYCILFAVFAFVFYSSYRYFRTGIKRNAVVLAGVMGIFLISAINDSLVMSFQLPWIFISDIGFFSLVVIMSLNLSMDVVRASEMSRKLSESEHTFQAIFNSTYQFIGLLNRDGVLLDANEASLRYTGARVKDVRGKFLWDTPWWKNLPEEQKKMRRALDLAASGEFVRYESLHRDRDGNTRAFDFSLQPVKDPDGRTTSIIAEGRDVNDVKAAEEMISRQNQELQALNEELKATIEELEATNEEFEAQNEELINSEHEIRLGQATLQSFINALPEPAFLVDRDLTFLAVNSALCASLGRHPRELLGHNAFSFIPKKLAELRMPCFERCFSSQKPVIFEDSQDGRTYINYIYPVIDEKGTVFRIAVFALDITERKHAEEAHKTSEEKYRNLVENISEVIVASDENGVLTYVSPSIERISGFSPEQMLGRFFIEFVAAEDRDLLLTRFSELMSGVLKPSDYRILTKSGELRWVRSYSKPVMEGGRLKGIRGVISDIHDQKLAEEALRRSEDRFRRIIESSPLPIVLIRDGKFIYCNSAYCGLIGVNSPEEIISRSLLDIVPPEKREEMKSYLENRSGRLTSFESVGMKIDGTRFFYEAHISRIALDDGPVNLVYVRDISERVKAGMEREKIQAQLIQAQKMEAMGTLAGGLAHDFNNMLGGIMGSLDLTELLLEKEDLNQREAIADYLQTAMESSRRATDLTRQLLTLSRKQELRLAPVDVSLSLKHIAKMCRNSLPKSVELDFPAGEGPLRIHADPFQIEQVVLNLCVNASHAMTVMRPEGARQGGRLSVSTALIRCESDFCSLHPEAVKDSSYVMIRVSDTGVGMDAGTLKQIFDPFFTANKKDEGTGLGLAIAYSIVKLHGGFIDVYSEPGRGSTFVTYLPALPDEDTAVRRAPASSDIVRGSGRVLIIDDEQWILRVARGMLEQCGYEVQCADSGPAGIELFGREPAAFDAVLLDLSMPGMSGLETYEKLKAAASGVRILLTSGILEDEQVRKAMDNGIRGFLQKPYTAGELSRKMREILS